MSKISVSMLPSMTVVRFCCPDMVGGPFEKAPRPLGGPGGETNWKFQKEKIVTSEKLKAPSKRETNETEKKKIRKVFFGGKRSVK